MELIFIKFHFSRSPNSPLFSLENLHDIEELMMDDEIVKDLETETPDLHEPKRSQVIKYKNSTFFLFFPLAFLPRTGSYIQLKYEHLKETFLTLNLTTF